MARIPLVTLLAAVAGCSASIGDDPTGGVVGPGPGEGGGGGGGGGGGSGSGSGSGSGGGGVTPTGYLQQIASVQCGEAFACQGSYPAADYGVAFADNFGASPGECTDRVMASWMPATFEAEVAKGRIMFDGAAATSCVAGVTFGSCTEFWTSGPRWDDACYQVLVGTVPQGGDCLLDYDCTTYYCDLSTQRCAPQPTAPRVAGTLAGVMVPSVHALDVR